MASNLPLLFLSLLFLLISLSNTQTLNPFLPSTEQESLYTVLESINPTIPWRTLYPDDLCNTGPRGIVCDYFTDSESLHVSELSFGYVSYYSANPPCTPHSTFSPNLTSFTHLRKLFFYNCFTFQPQVPLLGFLSNLSSSLEELVFMENPSLVGSLNGEIGKFSRLRRLVLSKTSVSGEIPEEVGDLLALQQLTLTRSRFNGGVPLSIGRLKKLRVLDLSYNGFDGSLPDSLGNVTELSKLDLGSNRFSGRIPDTFAGLNKLEFMDLSLNRFNVGIPLCLAEMVNLKEVYLSGNPLGGQIPEIWSKLGGILGIGLSGVGLRGKIPSSMGVFLQNLSYLGLDNNKLEGSVPEEFGMLKSVNELNLENNLLSGRLPFSAKFKEKVGAKLKLGGNPKVCVDEDGIGSSHLGYLKLCRNKSKSDITHSVILSNGCSKQVSSSGLVVILGACFWFVLVPAFRLILVV